METIQRDYAPKGVSFYYIYKALAHPELNGYVTPFTLEERLMHVKEAERTLGSKIAWICDTMENDLKHAFGDAPNSEFIIGPDATILERRAWSNPSRLRRDLEELVGAVERETRIGDLDMKTAPPPDKVASGIVPRAVLPGQMVPLKVEPVFDSSKTPFYVKLRVEATNRVLRDGAGKLYFGFHLDPIYRVHWNNLTDPLIFQVESKTGATITPAEGRGPKVNEAADSDPREFILDVNGAESGRAEMNVTVRYFACDNANTFCIPVTQRYTVRIEQDHDGGRARRGDSRRLGPFAGNGGGDFRRRLMQFDDDGDGKIDRDEAPEQFLQRFGQIDSNDDGFIDQSELNSAQPPPRFPGAGLAGGRMRMFEQMDANGDGKLTRDEASGPMAARFESMDSNRDGAVDRTEMESSMQRGRRGPGRR